MKTMLKRLVFWGVPAAMLVLALLYAFRPLPVDVDLTVIARGPLVSVVAEEGKTRIKDIFVLSAPVRGRALRIEVDEGDVVIAEETVIAAIEPIDPAFLDTRSEAEAKAAVDRAKAASSLALAELAQARADMTFAAAEMKRIDRLRASKTVSARALEAAERGYKRSRAAIAAANATVRIRKAELAAAKVRMQSPLSAQNRGDDCACLPLHAPVNGQVLRVLHRSEGVVEAGEALAEIGDPGNLEIVVDFLSADAVRIKPGQRVIIDQWGGDITLNGRVMKVEPYGFTKVSALGIEEQRVNAVIALTDPAETWRRLGHGFQVEAQVVLWETERALKAPLTALFRDGGKWAVFVVEDGEATVRHVAIGHKTDFEVQILQGLAPGEIVIQYPNDRIEPGKAVRQRNSS